MLRLVRRFFSRPALMWPLLRGQWLFHRTHLLLKILPSLPANIKRGRNVRQQRLRCVYTDGPQSLIELGDHCIIYEDAQVGALQGGQIHLGRNSILGKTQIFSRQKIEIGTHFMTAWNVLIQDYDSHPTQGDLRQAQVESIGLGFRPIFGGLTPAEKIQLNACSAIARTWVPDSSPISIGNNVWVGVNACIFKGAKIGNHCVIASNSIVTAGTYDDHSVIAGSPAKVIKKLQ